MSNKTFDFKKLLKESQETLLNPKDYFSSMSLSGGMTEPLLKAVFYGTIAGLLALLWSVLGLSAMGGFGGFWGGAIGIMALIWSIIGSIIAVFVGGAIMLVISAICGGNTDYEACVRVTASLMVIYPINAFLAFFYGISLTLGSLVGVVVSLYSIYLMYQAVVQALKGKESAARIVAIVLVALIVIGFFAGRRATQTFQDYSDQFGEVRTEYVDQIRHT
ncbi:MAG: YIP1 family protein [Bacteroidales bacterium]|nr:YIP1 family protein [Bacteroidales bacterium]